MYAQLCSLIYNIHVSETFNHNFQRLAFSATSIQPFHCKQHSTRPFPRAIKLSFTEIAEQLRLHKRIPRCLSLTSNLSIRQTLADSGNCNRPRWITSNFEACRVAFYFIQSNCLYQTQFGSLPNMAANVKLESKLLLFAVQTRCILTILQVFTGLQKQNILELQYRYFCMEQHYAGPLDMAQLQNNS